MERAAGIAVDILFVLLGHRAQPRHVQMRVQHLQRIERPLDHVEAHRDRALPLCELQTQTETRASRVPGHAEHVRPLRRPSVLERRNGVHEAFELLSPSKAPIRIPPRLIDTISTAAGTTSSPSS